MISFFHSQFVLADEFRAASKFSNCLTQKKEITVDDVAAWANCWGRYEYVSANGIKTITEGEFISGRLNGRWRIAVYEKGESRISGFIYVGDFKDGNYHGVGTYIHRGDEKTYGKRVGQFKNGRFDGLGVEYAGDGSIIAEGVWENDELIKQLKTPYSK